MSDSFTTLMVCCTHDDATTLDQHVADGTLDALHVDQRMQLAEHGIASGGPLQRCLHSLLPLLNPHAVLTVAVRHKNYSAVAVTLDDWRMLPEDPRFHEACKDAAGRGLASMLHQLLTWYAEHETPGNVERLLVNLWPCAQPYPEVVAVMRTFAQGTQPASSDDEHISADDSEPSEPTPAAPAPVRRTSTRTRREPQRLSPCSRCHNYHDGAACSKFTGRRQ